MENYGGNACYSTEMQLARLASMPRNANMLWGNEYFMFAGNAKETTERDYNAVIDMLEFIWNTKEFLKD